jgi:hypothetical protein
MANKIVVTSSNILITSANDNSTILLPVSGTFNLSKLGIASRYFSAEATKKGSGLLSCKLYDKDNTLIKTKSLMGKLGYAAEPEDQPFSHAEIEVRAADTESVVTDEDSAGAALYTLNVSPTNYSTGKLVAVFSGGVYDLSTGEVSLYGSKLSDNTPAFVPSPGATINSRSSGHMEIEINFTVVAV